MWCALSSPMLFHQSQGSCHHACLPYALLVRGKPLWVQAFTVDALYDLLQAVSLTVSRLRRSAAELLHMSWQQRRESGGELR